MRILLVKEKDRYIILGENITLGSTNPSDLNVGGCKYKLSFKNCSQIERENEIREYFKWHKEKEYVSHKDDDIKEYVKNSPNTFAWEVGMAVGTQCSCVCHQNSNIIHFMACCNPGAPIKDLAGCIVLNLI